jgi:glycerol-3-phosphate dehydrogenase
MLAKLMMLAIRDTDAYCGQDGRVLYLLPWEGSTIAGTTDIVSLSYRVVLQTRTADAEQVWQAY